MQHPLRVMTPEIEWPEIDCLETRVIDPMIRDPDKTLLKGILAPDIQFDGPLAKGLPLDPGDAIPRRLIHMRDTARIYRKSTVDDFISCRLRGTGQPTQQAHKKQ